MDRAYTKHLKSKDKDLTDVKVIRWYISTGGFTKEATEYMKTQSDVCYSDYDNVNALCLQYGSGYSIPI